MNQAQLINTLRSAAAVSRESTVFCPPAEQIARYADGALSVNDRQRLERHLADCLACLSRIGLLSQLADRTDDSQSVPAATRMLAERRSGRATNGWLRPAWAIAASMMLGILVAISWVGKDSGQSRQEPDRATRSAASLPSPQVLTPQTATPVPAGELVFRWTDVPDSLFYEVRVVSAAGDHVGGRQVAGTRWFAAGELALEPGEEYFVRVDAYLSDGKRSSSDHLPFRVTHER